MDKEKFGSLIREYRTRQGLSIRKFSQVSGVSTTQIQSIETASITTEPTVATINKLVAGLDLEAMEAAPLFDDQARNSHARVNTQTTHAIQARVRSYAGRVATGF